MDQNLPASSGRSSGQPSFLPPRAASAAPASLPSESLEDDFPLAPPVPIVKPPPMALEPAMVSRPTQAAERTEPNAPSKRDAARSVDDDDRVSWSEFLQGAPPWLGSLVVHMLMLIFLGLIVVVAKKTTETADVAVQAIYAEKLGEQLLEDNTLGLSTDKPDLSVDKTANSPVDLPPVADPFAAPPMVADLNLSAGGRFAASSRAIDAPIGLALSGRERGRKVALLGKYGGTALTEDAVHKALEWLKRNQRGTGLWSLNGPYPDGADQEDKTAATAMALLAFQGAGYTHTFNADSKHDYKAIVKRGWDALLKHQNGEGQFTEPGMPRQHQLYAHAQATIALCELYGMTEDSSFRGPAEKAIQFCVKSQDQQGGWRYDPGSDTDTSATGWFVMALQSALMAGLQVPPETFQNVSKYLDSAQFPEKGQYYYKPGTFTTNAMTAEALLCRQYLGWKRDDPRLITGVDFLQDSPVGKDEVNAYYWYYGTQVMHHMGGEYWNRWNERMRQYLPETQIKKGQEDGSWDPSTDHWGFQGGRLFITCLRAFMLEVYYRHLPIYANVYEQGRQQVQPEPKGEKKPDSAEKAE